MKMIAEVIVDISNDNVDRVFDYIVPASFIVDRGHRVVVPFGKNKRIGFVLKLKESSSVDESKLKKIINVIEEKKPITDEMLDLLEFMVKRFNLRYIDAIRLFIPAQMRKTTKKALTEQKVLINQEVDYDAVLDKLRKNAFKQRELLEYVKNNQPARIVDLNKKFYARNVNSFIQNGVLITKDFSKTISFEHSLKYMHKDNDYTLNKDQNKAIQNINKLLGTNAKILLHGVTGSGKTEVYLNVISKVVSKGQKAILLVPEISLTPQMLEVVNNKFKDMVAMLHSGLTQKQRIAEWMKIYNDNAQIIIGPRSAIFSPISNLGVIIMDEEHDPSYISESNPRYSTSDVAIFRSKYNNCPLILGSATPSIDTYYRYEKGEYNLIEMKKRVNNKKMPIIDVVDMKDELLSGNSSFLSNKLAKSMEDAIEKNEQVMIFINRRGYSSFVRCNRCGYIPKCSDCDVSLVNHRADNQLKCHFCDKRYKRLNNCPECGFKVIKEVGVGTQKVVHELGKKFPDVDIFRMDNDTTQKRNSHLEILRKFANTSPAILVGTQMIAKGHDFENVSLVGVLDADLGLYFSDYKSVEKTYQLLTQVSGRAGREKHEGLVMVQTYSPNHYLFNFIRTYNYHAFYEKEKNLRDVTNFPPYTKIVRILITSEDEAKAKTFTVNFYNKMKELQNEYKDDFVYLNAMKPPVKRVKGRYRYQILARFYTRQSSEIIDNIYNIDNNIKVTRTSVFIEINPQSLR